MNIWFGFEASLITDLEHHPQLTKAFCDLKQEANEKVAG